MPGNRKIPTLLAMAVPLGAAMAFRPAAAAIPQLDHVVVIVMENHAYQQVAGLPYMLALTAQGSRFTASYAVTHPSQPNYIALWSGGLNGVADNSCPAAGFPLMVENLGQACEAAGISWRAYCEGLPSPGSPVCSYVSEGHAYARKHAPWTQFGNLDHQNERPLPDLAADIAAGTLPRLAVVVPDQCHNTHDCPVQTGDDWLAAQVPALIAAVGPHGAVIVTWDEDDSFHANRILTIYVGGAIKANYSNARVVTHYTHLRNICEMLGLTPFGVAAAETATADIFVNGTSAVPPPVSEAPVRLFPPTPNPSRGPVEIVFDAVEEAWGSTSLFDSRGREVVNLYRGAQRGRRRLTWSGRDASGHPVPAGVYYLRVATGSGRFDQKLIRLGP